MRNSLITVAALLLTAIPALAQDPHAEHQTTQPPSSVSQDWAKQAVDKSPRHHEWVNLKYGTRVVSAFVVYPEVKTKAAAVVVIHEIFGMSDWVQMLADEVAGAGYIAIAPDLLSGMGPNGGGTSSLDSTAIGKAIRDLRPDQITADLNAAADYVAKLPAANGKVAVAGFCWGGTQSFLFATNRPTLAAAFVFYGTGPETAEATAAIKAPVYGFYAGNDARVGATVPKTEEMMKAAQKKYDPVTYAGAGHGFMRAGETPPPPADAAQAAKDAYAGNKKAREEAWARWKALLGKM
ncbi:MAG TPA: dienelactone hydrolase family protein [Thermoanaerobaculia bacterium]|jgi:carboxymethylenebutenolidase|nr:dienelactone hydrolase family protein [Thermoanaerobaculia bacterium]